VWKKEEDQNQRPSPTPSVATATRTEPAATQTRKTGFATIGPSIVIKGEVTGDEDLLIQGRVDGSVALGLHSVTIGDGGRVKAGITGRIITVEGAVEGDLRAEEQIVLRGSARVKGDLNAPRVVLEDGATFRGLVDMGRAPELDLPDAKATTSRNAPSTTSKTEPKPTESTANDTARKANGVETSKSANPSGKAGSAGSTAKPATA
jgi:cytoskeletal protein CcmA (bactofilin family)